jgi:hypothetical protein
LAVTVPNPVIRSELRRLLLQLATDWTAARKDKARESVKASREVLDRLMAEDPTSPDLAAIDLALQDAATAF